MNYPRPSIPIQPVLSGKSLKPISARADYPSILNNRHIRYVTSGRIAITLALLKHGIGRNHSVLLPAYHCSSMVEPVLHVGARPIFFRIKPDTSIDLDDVSKKIAEDTRLLMVTHYFGFHQNSSEIRKFCDGHKLLLLEDCAHAFFGDLNGAPIGSHGDIAIASAMKFFPLYDGGCLVSNRESLADIQLEDPGKDFQFKAISSPLENALGYKRLPLLRPILSLLLKIKDIAWTRYKSSLADQNLEEIGPGASDGGYELDTAWLNKRMSWFSRRVINNSLFSQIAETRRANYLYLKNQLKGLPGIKPLYDSLPDGVVPYVYPALIDNPETVFPILKNKGVPILRFGEYLWDDVNEKICPISIDYSRRVFQFPCHQELKPSEIDWMITEIKAALQAQ